ncbi:LuxR family transcriptional regulator [Bradyrhizobium sp. CCBAU 53421]|uniref:LuxR family transcriptional regulator n=1 Tax=Bradyrhizobium sp. CCBAU 53421 TaxID=1325120 RepID=UPI00188D4858|nr:LuxR family transcriptional regulator [Bradyrhizobium sp. CCBAU 53421]QOZ32788.1 LuxR family transcriptional regulator [Bradyrhizobium sp. CCBAU 53421]
MHRVFQTFIDMLAAAKEPADFSRTMVITAESLDLSCFAYLALPRTNYGKPRLISNYPNAWTSHYLKSRYQRIDPVIQEALGNTEPFRWGLAPAEKTYSSLQQQMLDEASNFGIRLGFTVPIHDGHGPIAALTFAASKRSDAFETFTSSQARVLQLIAMYFHAHVRRKLRTGHRIAEVFLSPRELECLEWASQGKSAWEIGCILGISRNTVAYYLENAKEKLGVRTVVQAVTLLAAANKGKQN